MIQHVVEDWRSALGLRSELERGRWPQPRPELCLSPGESGYATFDAALDCRVGVALAFLTSDPSTHAAAQRWEPMIQGTAWLTDWRLLICGAGEESLGWMGLQSLGPDLDGVVFDYASGQYLLRTYAPVWLDTMIRAIAFRQIANTRPPPWVQRQLGQ